MHVVWCVVSGTKYLMDPLLREFFSLFQSLFYVLQNTRSSNIKKSLNTLISLMTFFYTQLIFGMDYNLRST